jgi:hypothetical protein
VAQLSTLGSQSVNKATFTILIYVAIGSGLLVWQGVRLLFAPSHQSIEALTLPDQPTFNGLPRIVAAVKSYSRDHISRRQPLPASVTFQDLISGGYISTNDVRNIGVADATFYPVASNRDPKAVLVRVRMLDGSQIIALTDGSVQKLSR